MPQEISDANKASVASATTTTEVSASAVKLIPEAKPKNSAGKTVDNVIAFLLTLVPDVLKEDFKAVYGERAKFLPMELDGALSVRGAWGAFVIDFMMNATSLLSRKGYTFVDKVKLSKVCAISLLGLLDMYELNNSYSKKYSQFFKFKDGSISLFSCERTIAICCKYGIQLDEADIECIDVIKNFERGEKMTLCHASPLARLFLAAYQLTRIDYLV